MALTVTPFEVSSWSTTTTPKTISVTGALTGDKIVVLYGGDNGFSGNVSDATVSTTGGSTSSWTEPEEGLAAAGQAWTSSSSADVTADGTVTVSLSRTQSTGTLWGGFALLCSGHNGLGVHTRVAPSAAETASLTVSQGSAVTVLAVDWDALAVVAFAPGGSTEVERSQQGPGPDLTFYAAYWLNQAAGTRGYGIGTSSTTSLHIIAIEILAPTAAVAGGVQSALPGKTWKRRFKHRQQAAASPVSAAAATNAPAGLASATGTADNPNAAIATGPTAATAPGTANNPSVSTGSATNAAAATATATGAADNPTIKVAPGPSAATGTGTAQNATPTSTASALPTTATATGAAQGATVKVAPSPTTATGSGVASNPTVQTGSFTNAAAATATGTGTAQNTTSKVSPTPTTATAAGTANNPTVSTGSSTNASATLASATGTANNPAVTRSATANAGVATATGSASPARWSLAATANAAVAIATAYNALIAGAETNARSTPSVTAKRAGIATVDGESDMAAVTAARNSTVIVTGRTSIPTATSSTHSNSSVTE